MSDTTTVPPSGGSWIRDPETGELVREGGTEPQTEPTPNEAFDGVLIPAKD